MKRRLSPKEARRILKKVPERFSFWLCTNEMLKSLKHLGDALNRVNDDVFRYHTSRDKNDFENWIRDVVQDKDLARDISRIRTRHTLVRKINERLDELKKIVKASERIKKIKRGRKKVTRKGKKVRKKGKKLRKRIRRAKRATKKRIKKKVKGVKRKAEKKKRVKKTAKKRVKKKFKKKVRKIKKRIGKRKKAVKKKRK